VYFNIPAYDQMHILVVIYILTVQSTNSFCIPDYKPVLWNTRDAH